MFCTRCGTELEERHSFCFKCGTPTPAAVGRGNVPMRRLMRSRIDKKIAGVCGGLALHFETDPTLVRIIFLVLLFGVPPVGFVAYIVAWIAMPMEPLPPLQYPVAHQAV